MALDTNITQILKQGNSIVFKNAADEIIKIIPCYDAHLHPNDCDSNTIYFNETPSNRDRQIDNLVIDCEKVVDPVPPGSVWDRNELIDFLLTNFVNCSINVTVDNQLDLSTIEALLTQIRDSTAAIDENTDEVETKLDSIITEIQDASTLNNTNLLQVITLLQNLDSNTDNLENQLAQIILNTSTNATEATLAALLTAFNGTDFATESTVSGIKDQTDKLSFTPGNSLNVNVTNQLDLSTIESLLTQIRDSAAAIDANTDEVESKLDDVISELQTNGSTNNTNLLAVIAELQAIEANTDSLEAQLTSIITNTSLAATEATLLAIKAKTDQLTFTANKLRTTGEDGGGGSSGSIDDKLLQVDSEGTTTYLGYADPGSLTSASVWAVKRIIETGNDASITWADGNNNFDNIWDDRLTLTYS